LDELRGQDWASRSVRGKARRVDAARAELTAALGRVPNTTELAEAMGTGAEQIAAIEEDVHRSAVLSLQGLAGDVLDDLAPEQRPGPEQLLLDRERLGYLRDAVEALPARLRTVVVGYFFQERPMAELAAQFGVTESRISQLRAEALMLLRDGLNAQLAPERVSAASRPDGCAARRRAGYYAQIAAVGTLRTRLAHTSRDGLALARIA
jgi:RNA polymerase sigma factor for flagellar operon FliA